MIAGWIENTGWEFPTPVGMNRLNDELNDTLCRVPHARGDEPEIGDADVAMAMSSPRPWG